VRIRTALAGALVMVVATLGFAPPAGAAESIGSCVAEVALELEELIAGGMSESDALHEVESRAERCVQAPNPVLPDMVELFWISLAFGILLVVGLWKGYPAVTKVMNERTERIRADLEAAETAKLEAQAEQARYQESLGDAKAEAARIIDEARAAADALRTERTAAADAEAADIRAKANADAESIKAQALADLRNEVAALAVGAAERVVGHSLDAQAQADLINNYIDQVGSRN
jgi:F-type H+-transporting ATPase subunit b